MKEEGKGLEHMNVSISVNNETKSNADKQNNLVTTSTSSTSSVPGS